MPRLLSVASRAPGVRLSPRRGPLLLPPLFLAPLVALAGIGGFPEAPSGFHPVNTDKVRMLSLRYEVSLHLEYAEVFMEYVLQNPGPAVTVTAGFPCAGPVNGEQAPPPAPVRRFPDFLPGMEPSADNRFKIRTEEDEPVYVMKAPVAPGNPPSVFPAINHWEVFHLNFAEGQTRRLQIRCREPFLRAGKPDTPGGTSALALGCLLSPAAVWDGPIRHGVVVVKTVTADERELRVNRPERFRQRSEGLTWNFTGLEPTEADNVLIAVSPGYEVFPAPGADGLNEYRLYRGDGPDGGPPETRWELHRRDYAVTATSVLPDRGEVNYRPDNLRFDTGESTAWIEGAERDGIGESLTLTLSRPAPVSRVGVVNGYVKTKELYLAKNRVAALDVSVNGEAPFRVALPDERLERERFYFDLPDPGKPVQSIKLTIASVYDGSRHEETALSEVVLVTPLNAPPGNLAPGGRPRR